MSYQRRASPLHTARAAVACLYCLALLAAALLIQEQIVLGAIVVSMLGAGAFAGVGRELRRALLFAVPIGLLIAVINMFASQQGLTVIARLGDLPVLGNTEITLEATVYGGVLALRAIALIACGALYTLAVDPDQVLALFRRVSFRSALTATLATRLVPVLVRDSRRVADAQRCRAVGGTSRFAVMRAVGSGVLDRALNVAAALEVRGYGGAGRPARVRAMVAVRLAVPVGGGRSARARDRRSGIGLGAVPRLSGAVLAG
ncbi:MAG TPA: energy-coupling factor transporter transmembrane component T [Solirubrobacteraceae bacterium]|nr:energy-coupling factor transporter transmembrane component T [Solirubrobacteraceae bacterium]